ncbi:hypothetical protein Dimus_001278 [Dionaea muscipula]
MVFVFRHHPLFKAEGAIRGRWKGEAIVGTLEAVWEQSQIRGFKRRGVVTPEGKNEGSRDILTRTTVLRVDRTRQRTVTVRRASGKGRSATVLRVATSVEEASSEGVKVLDILARKGMTLLRLYMPGRRFEDLLRVSDCVCSDEICPERVCRDEVCQERVCSYGVYSDRICSNHLPGCSVRILPGINCLCIPVGLKLCPVRICPA